MSRMNTPAPCFRPAAIRRGPAVARWRRCTRWKQASAEIGRGLDDHWRASLHVAVAAHFGPALVDRAELSAPGSRMAVAVGYAIDQLDAMRAELAGCGGGVAVSEALLAQAGEPLGRWGDAVVVDDLAVRLRPVVVCIAPVEAGSAL